MSPAVLTAVMLTAVTSFAAALAMTHFSAALGFTDPPNERSLHTRVTPRAGGVGFALAVPAATAGTLAIWSDGLTAPIVTLLIASLTIAVVGLADDRWRLPVTVRLLAQFAAAGVVVQACGLSFARDVVATIAIVAVTNIYNFMDGIDGIAGSQALIASLCLALLAFLLGRPEITMAMLVLAGGVSGFLILNWPPARIFMGDVGSTFLGFSFSGWALIGVRGNPAIPIWAWAAALSPFLFDGVYTLVRRLLRGEPLYRAHRSHLYQQLVRRGWSHRKTTCVYAGLAAWSGVWVVLSGVGDTPPAVAIVATMASLCALPLSVRRQSLTRNIG